MVQIVESVAPPSDTSVIWLDKSIAGARVSAAPADHVLLLPGDGTTYYQEPCAFEVDGYTYLITFSTNTGVIGFVHMSPTPMVPESWVLLGNLTLPAPYNGEAYCKHAQIRVLDGQLVLIGADTNASPNALRMWTAPLPAVGGIPSFTYSSQLFTLTQWGGTQFGNTDPFKLPSGSYMMSIEAYISSNWNQGYASGSALTSLAALSNGSESLQLMQSAPLTSATGAGSGGNWHTVENEHLINIFAGGKMVGEIYRARAPLTGTDVLNWENLDGDKPLVRRGIHPEWQQDQVADPFVLTDGVGNNLLFYTGVSNGGKLFSVFVTPMMPVLRQYQRGSWVPINQGGDQHGRTWNRPQFVADGDYAAQPGDEVFFYGLTADRILTLPLAGNSAQIRVHVIGNSAYRVIPRPNAGNNGTSGARDRIMRRTTGVLGAAGADGDPIYAGDDVTLTAMVFTDGTWNYGNRASSTQSPAYAASFTPDFALGLAISPGALTGAITVNNPSNVPVAGTRVTFVFTQDATGSRAVSWGTNYVFPTAWSNTGNTASTKSTISFVSDGTKLVAQGANVWY